MTLTPPTQAAQTLQTIRTEMKSDLIERDAEIDLLILSIIARTHLLLLGTGGVAKSMTINLLLDRITGATKFKTMLRKSTPVEALVGPTSLTGLTQDRFEHVTTNMLPVANVAFLDEIFKANAVTLNAMLSILNERVFHNGTLGAQDVPLWCGVGASNETPSDPDLGPFRDRFGSARIVQPVQSDDGFMRILRGQIDRDAGVVAAQAPTTIDKSDIEALQAAVTAVTVPDSVLRDVVQMRRKAEGEANLVVSARRFGEGIRLCKAQALLSGRTSVTSDDLVLFQHNLWTDPEDVQKAYEVVLDFAGKATRVANALRKDFEPLRKQVTEVIAQNKSTGTPDMTKLTEASVGLRATLEKVEKAVADAESADRDTSDLNALASEVKAARKLIRDELFSD